MKYVVVISALCLSAQLFGAADDANLHGAIKVYKPANSTIQHQLAFDQAHTDSIAACFIADEKLEEGTATEMLKDFNSSDFRILTTDSAKWVAVFLIKPISLDQTLCTITTNKTTEREIGFQNTLSLTLNDAGTFTLAFKSNKEETWSNKLKPNEIGLEIDSRMVKQILNSRRCSIL